MAEQGTREHRGRASRDLTQGTVARGLFRLAMPMFLGILSSLALNAVDTYFVGQLGTDELAAMSFTFPVVFFVLSLGIGLGIGATSVVSRAFGSGERARVRALTTHAMLLACAVVSAFTALGIATIRPLFTLMGAEPHLLVFIEQYMSVWYLGMGFLIVPLVGNAAIRATGDARTPAKIMVFTAFLNLCLDPLLIFGFGPIAGWGIQGAAVATVLARAVSFVLALWVLVHRERLVVWAKPRLEEVWASWRQILRIALPAAATNVIGPMSAAVLTALVAAYGTEAVAAFGAGTRLESMALLGPYALTAAIGPFVGQNWGAGRRDRVADALRTAGRASFAWCGLSLLVFVLLGRQIATAFTSSPAAIEHMVDYMLIVGVSLGFYGFLISVNATFNAIDRPLRSTALIVFRTLILALPLAWLGSSFYGVTGIFMGVAAANVVGSAAAWIWSRDIEAPAAADSA